MFGGLKTVKDYYIKAYAQVRRYLGDNYMVSGVTVNHHKCFSKGDD